VRWLVFPHLLALAWGVYVSVMPGLVCPLTPLENAVAVRAGMAGYEGSFIEHYLVPIVYPEGLTPSAQWALAGGIPCREEATVHLLAIISKAQAGDELQED
jgi:hypothetical protein